MNILWVGVSVLRGQKALWTLVSLVTAPRYSDVLRLFTAAGKATEVVATQGLGANSPTREEEEAEEEKKKQ